MKRIITIMVLCAILGIIYVYRVDIYDFYYKYFVPIEKKVTVLKTNQYYRDYNFEYVKNTDNFIPNNKQDLLNIYYTVINSGMTDFTFYCPDNYITCQNDINDIANDQNILSSINNFAHPYNSFKSIKTQISEIGQVNLEINKVYTEKMIYLIDYEIDKIIKEVITDKMNDETKIRKIHDYIINHTKYDKQRTDNKITKYSSDTAYGVLTEHYGVCGGYSDSMMLFLSRFNIKSIKVASENHVWNYVYLDNQWLHLDLTWDDPVSSDGRDLLEDTYFLITNQELINMGSEEHYFDTKIYN